MTAMKDRITGALMGVPAGIMIALWITGALYRDTGVREWHRQGRREGTVTAMKDRITGALMGVPAGIMIALWITGALYEFGI